MTPVLTRHAPEPVRKLRRVAAPVALVVLLVAVFVLLMQLVAGPATVDHIAISNRSDLELEVSIHPSGDPGSLPVAAMEARSTTTVDDVLDQGDEWVFRGEHAVGASASCGSHVAISRTGGGTSRSRPTGVREAPAARDTMRRCDLR